jgi:hypothetical protein
MPGSFVPIVGKRQPDTVKATQNSFLASTNTVIEPQFSVVVPAAEFQTGVTLPANFQQKSGFAKNLILTVNASGGVNGTTNVATQPDAPFNVIQSVLFTDPNGTPLYSYTGYELYLINKYGGFGAILGLQDPTQQPDYVPVSTGSSGTGNFNFTVVIPFEFAKGLGCIPWDNSAALPNIIIQIAPSSAVYSTAPGTVPSLTITCDIEYYSITPNGVLPDMFGTTLQIQKQVATPQFAANSSTPIVIPKLGGAMLGLILVIRDTTNARVDAWPQGNNRLFVQLDTNIWLNSRFSILVNEMARQFYNGQPFSRETGVLVVTRKNSLTDANLGLLDSGIAALATQPNTSITLTGNTWGSGGSGTYTLSVLAPSVVPPAGAVYVPQGLKEFE